MFLLQIISTLYRNVLKAFDLKIQGVQAEAITKDNEVLKVVTTSSHAEHNG